jgi:radical SAM superfamily enzyme YgiQ (UPF0313 family)
MKVLLFYPENHVRGTVLPPYSLLYIAKALQRAGHTPVIVDGRFEDKKLVEAELSSSDLFAVSAGMNMQFATSLPFAKMAQEYGTPVLMGGVFAALNHGTLLSNYQNIDGICLGEGEVSVVEAVERGVERASNVAYLKRSIIHRNPPAPFVRLDDYAPLPWELLDLQRYVTQYKGMKVFYYTTSRGCPHRCSYCYQGSFWKSRWRGLSAERVREGIDTIADSLPIDAFYLFDDNFLVDKKRAEHITEHIHALGLKWSCMTRANYLDERLVQHLRAHGCFKLNVGAESGSQTTLERMKKELRIEDILQAARLIGEAGLSSEFYFMIGYQGEGMEDVQRTVEMADEVERLCGAETFIRVALPFKGTTYFESAKQEGFKRGDDLISLCTEDWGRKPPPLPWFTEEENRVLRNIATLSEIRFMKRKFLDSMPLWERVYIKAVFPLLEMRWKRRWWKALYELAPYELYEYLGESRRIKDSLHIEGCE